MSKSMTMSPKTTGSRESYRVERRRSKKTIGYLYEVQGEEEIGRQ